ncbi:hypothetical protein ACVMHR_000199 [Bradyrhizobium diazoefficiens]
MMLPPPPRATKCASTFCAQSTASVKIDVDDAAIGFDVERIARRFPLEAGIVDETVEALPARQDGLEHRGDVLLAADVSLDDDMIEPAVATVARCRPRERERLFGLPRVIEIVDGDGRAFLGEPDGNGTADALRGAGHQRVLANEARGKGDRAVGLWHELSPECLIIDGNDVLFHHTSAALGFIPRVARGKR